MHQSQIELPSNPSRPPIALREPAWVLIEHGVYPFSGFEAVSEAYRGTIACLGLGVSETPACLLLDKDERPVAQVAFNGRIYPIDELGNVDYSNAIFEPAD